MYSISEVQPGSNPISSTVYFPNGTSSTRVLHDVDSYIETVVDSPPPYGVHNVETVVTSAGASSIHSFSNMTSPVGGFIWFTTVNVASGVVSVNSIVCGIPETL